MYQDRRPGPRCSARSPRTRIWCATCRRPAASRRSRPPLTGRPRWPEPPVATRPGLGTRGGCPAGTRSGPPLNVYNTDTAPTPYTPPLGAGKFGDTPSALAVSANGRVAADADSGTIYVSDVTSYNNASSRSCPPAAPTGWPMTASSCSSRDPAGRSKCAVRTDDSSSARWRVTWTRPPAQPSTAPVLPSR